ncbi:hypothetical protein RvVAR0630_40850 [Agrobacterium vitis]|nr:hypothetical protein RvVAR0630_40850 [Agrobacterium vitis]
MPTVIPIPPTINRLIIPTISGGKAAIGPPKKPDIARNVYRVSRKTPSVKRNGKAMVAINPTAIRQPKINERARGPWQERCGRTNVQVDVVMATIARFARSSDQGYIQCSHGDAIFISNRPK